MECLLSVFMVGDCLMRLLHSESLAQNALSRMDGSDGVLHLLSDRCDFHSGIEQCLQLFVFRQRPRVAGRPGTCHFPFTFSPSSTRRRAAPSTTLPRISILQNPRAVLIQAQLAVESKDRRRSWSHWRGIGCLFGKGICPVIGSSLVPADACASGARLRIAVAACLKAFATCSSELGRRSIFVGVPVSGPVISGAVGDN